MGIEIGCRLILGIDDQRIGGAWRAPSSNATFCEALILAFMPVVLLGLIPPWGWKAGVGWVPVSTVAARAGAGGQHNFNRVWPGPELWPGYAVTGQHGFLRSRTHQRPGRNAPGAAVCAVLVG